MFPEGDGLCDCWRDDEGDFGSCGKLPEGAKAFARPSVGVAKVAVLTVARATNFGFAVLDDAGTTRETYSEILQAELLVFEHRGAKRWETRPQVAE